MCCPLFYLQSHFDKVEFTRSSQIRTVGLEVEVFWLINLFIGGNLAYSSLVQTGNSLQKCLRSFFRLRDHHYALA